jgi:hypothetical protein
MQTIELVYFYRSAKWRHMSRSTPISVTQIKSSTNIQGYNFIPYNNSNPVDPHNLRAYYGNLSRRKIVLQKSYQNFPIIHLC